MNRQSIKPATFRERLFPFLCGLFFLMPASILAFVTGGMGIESLTEQWRLKNWSTVSAIVEESQAIEQASGKYKFAITYHYSFKGEEFHSHRYEAFRVKPLIDHAKAQSLVHKYPPGTALTVYVDPTHPRHAFVNASMNYGLVAYLCLAFCLMGLYFAGYTIYLMWRSVTALCIVRVSRNLGTGSGTSFCFYDSLEAAQKDADWKPSPENVHKSSKFMARITPFLGALLFASIGIGGLTALITLGQRLPGEVVVVGFILMPAFTIMGIGGMWRTATAKYVVDTKGPYNQEEITFVDSEDAPPV
jgi:hypothetical protein